MKTVAAGLIIFVVGLGSGVGASEKKQSISRKPQQLVGTQNEFICKGKTDGIESYFRVVYGGTSKAVVLIDLTTPSGNNATTVPIITSYVDSNKNVVLDGIQLGNGDSPTYFVANLDRDINSKDPKAGTISLIDATSKTGYLDIPCKRQ